MAASDARETNLVPHVILEPSDARRMAAALVAFLVPTLTIAIVAQVVVEPRPSAEAVALSDLTAAQIVEIRDRSGAVVLSGEFRSRVDRLGNTEKDAELTNQRGAAVIGEVELEFPASGRDHRRPELEVDVIRLQPRGQYTIAIDDRTVGAFVTDDRGSADFELQEGETAPAMPGQ